MLSEDPFPNHNWKKTGESDGMTYWTCSRCGERQRTAGLAWSRRNPPTSFEMCDPEQVEVMDVLGC